MPGLRPKRVATTHVEVLDSELCIYEWTNRTVHALNRPAARVWEQCDGQTTVAQMADVVRMEFSEPHAQDIVGLALRDFRDAGLLEEVPVDLPGLSRRELVRRLAVASAVPVLTSIIAPTPLAAQSGSNPRVFGYTGSATSFTVPAGVTALTVVAHGGSGGGMPFENRSPRGLRGRVDAVLAVTPGEVLQIIVGGAGAVPTQVAGFNGGGPAGDGGYYGGGGSSDIRTALSVPLIIAGGGGGGGTFSATNFGANGGNGGGLVGAPGGAPPVGAVGGGGGTSSAGGAGGSGAADGGAGAAGGLSSGGRGGNGLSDRGGGGGGGGFFGGGGGGGYGADGGNGAGGGGGSSFADSLRASSVVHTQGDGSGDGQIVLSW